MRAIMITAGCGLCVALWVAVAQAQEPLATAAPMSLLANAPQHNAQEMAIPYRAQALPAPEAMPPPVLRGTSAQAGETENEAPPVGMRISYKRASNGSFVKTYVRESGTN